MVNSFLQHSPTLLSLWRLTSENCPIRMCSAPALSDGLMIVRARRHVYAIGRE